MSDMIEPSTVTARPAAMTSRHIAPRCLLWLERVAATCGRHGAGYVLPIRASHD